MNMGQFRGLVQQATGVKHTHRYRLLDDAVPQGATTHIPLLTADDTPDYDEDFDGAAAAPECETGSRILGIDFNFDFVPNGATEQIEYMIWKNPDAAITTSTVSPTILFQNDVTTTGILLRKYTMAYGRFLSTASKESSRTKLRISRAAMRRVGVMKQNDVLYLGLTHTATGGGDGVYSLHGRIWTRK